MQTKIEFNQLKPNKLKLALEEFKEVVENIEKKMTEEIGEKMINIKNNEAILEYEKTKKIFENKGKDYFFKLFERIFKSELYSFSEYWLEDKKFILKFKGSKGDVIISWK